MERPGQWPRGGHLRRCGDPALDPAWPAPVGHRREPAILDPDTTKLDKRAANARAQLCVLTQHTSHSLNRRNETDRPADLGPGSAGPTSLATWGSGLLRLKRRYKGRDQHASTRGLRIDVREHARRRPQHRGRPARYVRGNTRPG